MASTYIDKDFYLPDNMLNSSKTEVMIEYDDFIYDQGMIPVNFNYNLDLDDIHYLLKLIADEASLKYEGDMFKFLMVILDKYEEDIFDILDDFLNFNFSKNKSVVNKLKDKCRDKAFQEFKKAFEYWVDEEDIEDYYDKEEFI